ncbi:PAS domain S-box protein [Clostridium sp. YIM B02505]|uniref:PAS domain S-box protein n=1 Tax=Clostridium yunnanense TaxID=2800325 RepID=A0ABS1EX87_9CLOT|nr:PAS domain S-box protein [Clostridium yunnanense]MBK1813977.1 PAS domain S-box protein [Clostridium yunnanense]
MLIILFAISLRVLERYKFYNFHEVVDILKVAIVIISLFFLYACFKYLSYEERPIPIAIWFSYMYFCFEFMFRQVFMNLNIGGANSNLIESIVSYPFAIGLILRPIIILFALMYSRTKLFQTRNKNRLLLLIGLVLGICTTFVDIYIILPRCLNLSEQKIVITYINTLLVNSFVVIISIIYNINNREDFSNLLIYSTLLPIFAKYYAYYSQVQNSVFIVAAEVVMLSLLITGTVYLKISSKRLISEKSDLVRDCYTNNSIINKVSIDEKVGNMMKSYSKNVDSFIQSYMDIEDNLQEILFLVDVYGRINYASKRFYSLSELEEERVVGASFFTITHPEEILKARVLINLEKSHTTPIVHRIRKNNGKYILAESIADFIFEEGNIMGKIIVSRDISNENL